MLAPTLLELEGRQRIRVEDDFHCLGRGIRIDKGKRSKPNQPTLLRFEEVAPALLLEPWPTETRHLPGFVRRRTSLHPAARVHRLRNRIGDRAPRRPLSKPPPSSRFESCFEKGPKVGGEKDIELGHLPRQNVIELVHPLAQIPGASVPPRLQARPIRLFPRSIRPPRQTARHHESGYVVEADPDNTPSTSAAIDSQLQSSRYPRQCHEKTVRGPRQSSFS